MQCNVAVSLVGATDAAVAAAEHARTHALERASVKRRRRQAMMIEYFGPNKREPGPGPWNGPNWWERTATSAVRGTRKNV